MPVKNSFYGSIVESLSASATKDYQIIQVIIIWQSSILSTDKNISFTNFSP